MITICIIFGLVFWKKIRKGKNLEEIIRIKNGRNELNVEIQNMMMTDKIKMRNENNGVSCIQS